MLNVVSEAHETPCKREQQTGISEQPAHYVHRDSMRTKRCELRKSLFLFNLQIRQSEYTPNTNWTRNVTTHARTHARTHTHTHIHTHGRI